MGSNDSSVGKSSCSNKLVPSTGGPAGDNGILVADLVKLINDMKKMSTTIWDKCKHYVTVKRPDGKLIRHKIVDYGSMSRREYLSQLGKPTPEVALQYEELRNARLANFKPMKERWKEMENFSNFFARQAKGGPSVRYIVAQVWDFASSPALYIDFYVRKFKPKEQIVIFLGNHSGTYLDARDFLTSDIINNSMTKDQTRSVLQDFANGDFPMLFIAHNAHDQIRGNFDFAIWKNLRCVIIEEFANNPEELNFNLFLQSCSPAYCSSLFGTHVLTLLRAKSAARVKDELHSYMRKAYQTNGVVALKKTKSEMEMGAGLLQDLLTSVDKLDL